MKYIQNSVADWTIPLK